MKAATASVMPDTSVKKAEMTALSFLLILILNDSFDLLGVFAHKKRLLIFQKISNVFQKISNIFY